MTFEILKNENNVAQIKLVIDKDAFEAAVAKAYQNNRAKFNIDGFRKGKAPRAIIEQRYGKEIFYEEALDLAFPDAYVALLKETELKIVATPALLSIDEIGVEGATITIEVALDPEFELAEYKGIKVGSLKYTSKKADVEEETNALLEQNSRIVDLEEGKSNLGDTVVINFEGTVNGEPFIGGKGEAYPLELGSNTFIPGFEEQLVGISVGEEIDVKVKFPAEYHADDLAGEDAVFKTKIYSIRRKELPELDDDFAMDLGFDNLESLTKDVKAKLKVKKEEMLKKEAEKLIVDTVVGNTEIAVPAQMIAERAQDFKKDFESRVQSSTGLTAEQYYQFVLENSEDKDPNQFQKLFEEQAATDIKTSLVLRKIIEVEKLEVTDAEFNEEETKFAEEAKKDADEYIKGLNENAKEYIKGMLLQNKLFAFLLENADKTK